MRKEKRFLIASLSAALGVLLSVGSASAQDFFSLRNPEEYMFRFEGRVWIGTDSNIDGTFDDGANRISVDKGLGDETRFNPYLEWQFLKDHKLRLAYFYLSQDTNLNAQEMTVSVPVPGGGRVDIAQPQGANTISSMDLNVFDIGYQWDVLKGNWGFVAPLIDLSVVDFDVKATGRYDSNGDGVLDRNLNESESGLVPIPQLGIQSRVYLHPRIALAGEIKGMTLGSAGNILQLFVGPEVNIGQHLGINAGWRYLAVSVDAGDVDADYSDSGPYVGVVLRY